MLKISIISKFLSQNLTVLIGQVNLVVGACYKCELFSSLFTCDKKKLLCFQTYFRVMKITFVRFQVGSKIEKFSVLLLTLIYSEVGSGLAGVQVQ